MHRFNFTDYDEKPAGMINYMRYYGPHFSKKLHDFATSIMTKDDGKKITPYTHELVMKILLQYGVVLKYDLLYDSTYVANMCVADFLKSSIPDEIHLAKYVRDVIDDPDGIDGLVFNRWYADMCYKGIAIDWEEMI